MQFSLWKLLLQGRYNMAKLEFDSKQVMRALQELDKKVANKLGKEALREGAEPIYEQMLKNVPVAKVNGGLLKSSIQIGKTTGSVQNGTMKIKVGINPAMYEQVKYGFYQEYGTSVMLGKRWMARAWTNGVKESNEVLIKAIKKQIGLR